MTDLVYMINWEMLELTTTDIIRQQGRTSTLHVTQLTVSNNDNWVQLARSSFEDRQDSVFVVKRCF